MAILGRNGEYLIFLKLYLFFAIVGLNIAFHIPARTCKMESLKFAKCLVLQPVCCFIACR